jgi:uncharacterized protein (TIGR02646 family)
MAAVIPVRPVNAPRDFEERVRQPGLRWLETHGIPLETRLESGTNIHPYWRECLDELHTSYDGVCAYLCVFVERCTGGASTDHFVAKSRMAGLAYEWSNYRLACTTMNARKRDFEGVLDPFALAPDTFRLELVTGRIYPNPEQPEPECRVAQSTIDRLGLDDAGCRQMRARRFLDYVMTRGAQPTPPVEAQLRRYSPFLWLEAKRQGLL